MWHSKKIIVPLDIAHKLKLKYNIYNLTSALRKEYGHMVMHFQNSMYHSENYCTVYATCKTEEELMLFILASGFQLAR